MPGIQLCYHLQLGQEERAQGREGDRIRGGGDWKGGNKCIWRDWSGKTWRAHIESESRRVNHRERSKNPKRKTDGASEHPSFILPCNARADMRSRTRSQLPSLFLSLPLLFPLFANSLLLFPWAISYPSPDFGIKVPPFSSSTSNLLSSLFFHYTSLFPL